MRWKLIVLALGSTQVCLRQERVQRTLVVEKGPSMAVEQLLREPKIDEAMAKRFGLVRVAADGLELLVAEDLWNPSSIRLATVAMRALASFDGKSPFKIEDLPAECRGPILKALNGGIQARRSLFSPSTPVTFLFNSFVTASDGKSTRQFSVDRQPNGKAATKGGNAKSDPSDGVVPPPVAKRALIVRFPSPLPDRLYWEKVTAAFKKIEEHRRALEEAFQKEEDEMVRQRFAAGDEVSALQIGDSLGSLSSELRRQIRRGKAEEEKAFFQNARVSGVQRSVVLVFHFGNNEIVFSPRAMFDSP